MVFNKFYGYCSPRNSFTIYRTKVSTPSKMILSKENVKTQVNLNFFKQKGKSGGLPLLYRLKTLKILYISDDKMDLTFEFVSRNLVAQTNFVKFRDDQNFMYFKVKRINGKVTSGGMPHGIITIN